MWPILRWAILRFTWRSQPSASLLLLSVRCNQEQELLNPLSSPEPSCSGRAEEPLVAVVHLQGCQLLQGDPLLLQASSSRPLATASSREEETSSCKTHSKLASQGYQGQQLGLVQST